MVYVWSVPGVRPLGLRWAAAAASQYFAPEKLFRTPRSIIAQVLRTPRGLAAQILQRHSVKAPAVFFREGPQKGPHIPRNEKRSTLSTFHTFLNYKYKVYFVVSSVEIICQLHVGPSLLESWYFSVLNVTFLWFCPFTELWAENVISYMHSIKGFVLLLIRRYSTFAYVKCSSVLYRSTPAWTIFCTGKIYLFYTWTKNTFFPL
jgi:hypothetical protein